MHKNILRLGIPNILSNITIPLSSSIDTALMGHLSAKHLGAIALGSMIFVFLYGSFNFLRMGTTGMTAQSFGAKDKKEVSFTLYRALSLAVVLAVLVFLFQTPIKEMAIYFLNAVEYREYISGYFDIRVYAVLGALINFVLIGWFFGVSNSIAPLIMTVTINLSNAILSYIFVYMYDMDIGGVALGTVISQYLGLMVGVWYLRKYDFYEIIFKEIFKKSKLLNFFHINKDLFIRTIALTLALNIFYSFASKEGSLVLAVATVFMQFLTWSAYGIDGFANASESLVGKYFGAKDFANMRKAINYSLGYGLLVALVFSIIYALFLKELVYLFVNDKQVINLVESYKWYFTLVPIFGFLSFIYDGIMVGLTESKVLRDSVLVGFLMFLGLYYLGFGLFFSFCVFFIIRGVYQIIWLKGEMSEYRAKSY